MIKSLVLKDKVLGMLIFVILVNITPYFDSLTNFYLTDNLKFSAMDIANFSTIGTIFYLLGLIIYTMFFLNVSPK